MGHRRYKPTLQQRKATHHANDDDFKKLAAAVVKAIALKQKDVFLRFPYFVRLPDDFPKGVCYKRDQEYDYFRAKAFKLADWLYKHGHMSTDAKGVVKSMRTVVNLMGHVERLLTDPVKIMYNGNSLVKNVKEGE